MPPKRHKKQVEADESPAVQLYQLVMRAVREPSSIFSVAEKKVLRNLLVRDRRELDLFLTPGIPTSTK